MHPVDYIFRHQSAERARQAAEEDYDRDRPGRWVVEAGRARWEPTTLDIAGLLERRFGRRD